MPDDLIRTVIVVGIPYLPTNDKLIEAKVIIKDIKINIFMLIILNLINDSKNS